MSRPRILTFVGRYLPGYKSGGPIRTLANMVEHLSDEFEFWIVTDDRDAGDLSPYPGVRLGEWTMVGKGQVLYMPRARRGVAGIRRIIRTTPHDVLYLNSFFSGYWGVVPLVLRRLGVVPSVQTVLAPRGELRPSALAIKPLKKTLYRVGARAFDLHRNLLWQASSEEEASEIRARMAGTRCQIIVAPDLLPRRTSFAPAEGVLAGREPGPFRVLMLGRISPIKNHLFLLEVLSHVRRSIRLTIVGPVDDDQYWQKCRSKIAALPSNIQVDVRGPAPNEQVAGVMASHDLFVLPTKNENFGHVIPEALAAGTPVLVSDRTPWTDSGTGGLTVVPLDSVRWRAVIESWCSIAPEELAVRRRAASALARSIFSDSRPLDLNRQLFRLACVE
jgi:glycosyltransferase involved in cell wall biosynthesis